MRLSLLLACACLLASCLAGRAVRKRYRVDAVELRAAALGSKNHAPREYVAAKDGRGGLVCVWIAQIQHIDGRNFHRSKAALRGLQSGSVHVGWKEYKWPQVAPVNRVCPLEAEPRTADAQKRPEKPSP